MKTLKDIQKDIELRKRILWHMTPQENFSEVEIKSQEDLKKAQRDAEARAGYYFFIDVWDMAPRLCLFENRPDGSGEVVGIVEAPERMLDKAIEEAGGAINISGHYPINRKIRNWLMKKLL
ncbi:MAG: DVU0772 family protein [Ignavibacteriales bacterium]